MNDIHTLFAKVDVGKLIRRFQIAALNQNVCTLVVLFEYDYTTKEDVEKYGWKSILERMPGKDERLIHHVIMGENFQNSFTDFLKDFANMILNPEGYQVNGEKQLPFVLFTRNKITSRGKDRNRVQLVLDIRDHSFLKHADTIIPILLD